MASDTPAFRNGLLSFLPPAEVDLLARELRPVTLVLQQVVHEVGDPFENVYFLESGLVSLTADTGNTDPVEVGMVGREGMVGVTALLSADATAVHKAIVQIPGTALRLRAAIFRDAAEQLPVLRDRCFRYVQFIMAQTGQSAACNARHTLPERLARWLLMGHDRVDGDELPMRQEFLSYMLGVRRAGVSTVTTVLQAQGIIRQTRGRLTVLDRAKLEDEACPCYRIIEESRRRIMG